MILLRELKEEDAELMIEWMHDADIQKGFRKNMMAVTLDDAKKFCRDAKLKDKPSQGTNCHFAIVDSEDDEYLGTISLKNIDLQSMVAEYAITTRKKASGKGVGFIATDRKSVV